jgi:hypothetical protein
MRSEPELHVLVVGDDHLARAGLAALLSDQPGCTVVGQVAGSEYATLSGGGLGLPNTLRVGWKEEAIKPGLTKLSQPVYESVILSHSPRFGGPPQIPRRPDRSGLLGRQSKLS